MFLDNLKQFSSFAVIYGIYIAGLSICETIEHIIVFAVMFLVCVGIIEYISKKISLRKSDTRWHNECITFNSDYKGYRNYAKRLVGIVPSYNIYRRWVKLSADERKMFN